MTSSGLESATSGALACTTTRLRMMARAMSIVAAAAVALVLGMGPWLDTPAQADSLVATVPVGTSPLGVGVNPTTNKIYVANSDSNSVSVINGATNRVTTLQSPAFAQPREVGVNPNTNRIYVGNFGANTVTVIDGSKDRIEKTITVGVAPGPLPPPGVGTIPGSQPDGIAVNPSTNRIYVANQFDGTVAVIDGSKNVVTNTIPLGLALAGAAVNPKTNQVYVSLLFGSSLEKIRG